MHRCIVNIGTDRLLSSLLARVPVSLLLVDNEMFHARYDILL